MSLINVTNVEVLDNPTKFTNDLQFVITFECVAPGITEELEWKLTYVGSADDEKHDQELDSVLVGPVKVGKSKFAFQAPAPDISKIPEKDILGVTVILLTCSYREREFIRIGYYVSNFQVDQHGQPVEILEPTSVNISNLCRSILADKPRVTRFPIPWDQDATAHRFKDFEASDSQQGADQGGMGGGGDGDGMNEMEDDFEEYDEEDDSMDDEDDMGMATISVGMGM